jgi:hypothetical protein
VQNRAALQPRMAVRSRSTPSDFIESRPLFTRLVRRIRAVCRPVLIVDMDESFGEYVVKWSEEGTAGEPFAQLERLVAVSIIC